MPKRTDIHSILIIGSGPIVIGQGCEFDYSGVQACRALKEEGYRVVLINSNPATIMTDPEFADATYIEPITPEAVEKILQREAAGRWPIDAVLPTLGGQTGLNTAMACYDRGIFKQYNVKMIGADREAINRGEDRQVFKDLMISIGLKVPRSGVVHNMADARQVLADLGLPLIIRPAFTLGGTGGGIAYNIEEFEEIVQRGLDASPVTEVLIEQSVIGWKEYELEVMRDKNDNVVIICSIENIDAMGVHTGDSITVAPVQTLSDKEYQRMRDAAIAIIRAVGVETGGSNIQFGVNPDNGEMVVIEMNPRVSRSSALASKATGYPIAKIAAKLAVGYTLDELPNYITSRKDKSLYTSACFEPTIDYCVVKIPRWTFEKFPDADETLTTQMKSVGEAMAIGRTFKEALQKGIRSMEVKRFGFGLDQNDKWLRSGSRRGDPVSAASEDATRATGVPPVSVASETATRGTGILPVSVASEDATRGTGILPVSVASEDATRGTGVPPVSAASEHATPTATHSPSNQHGQDARATRGTGVPPVSAASEHATPTATHSPSNQHGQDARATDARATDARATDARATDARATDARATDTRATDQTMQGESADDEWPIPGEKLRRKLAVPSQGRLYYIRYAMKMGWSLDEIHELTHIDKWFLSQMKELVDFEAELLEPEKSEPRFTTPGVENTEKCGVYADLIVRAKQLGYSDVQLANVWQDHPKGFRKIRQWFTKPVYKLVDTCAAEFEAATPYYYSTYETPFTQNGEEIVEDEIRLTDKPKVIIIGGGPNRIGQGIEFDYCCVQAAFAMREIGYESVMINSNPETVSTDYDTSDLLFFEPLTHEDILNICERLNGGPFGAAESRNLVHGVIVQFGGQTPLNLARGLRDAGVPILGTTVDSIDAAGDREQFRTLLQQLKIRQPSNGIAHNLAEARKIAREIGYPVLVRPSFVLGGRAMEIVSDEEQLNYYMAHAVEAVGDSPILVDKFLDAATECDVDCIGDFDPTGKSDAGSAIVIGVMEHIEEAGIHSGDSACALPPYSLSPEIVDRLKTETRALAKALRVRGLMNVQYAIKDGEIYVIEVNPRASRTVPFVSKATGVPWAKIAAKVMAGKTLAELGAVEQPDPAHVSVKESVFPFAKFPGVDVILGPEMRSTGEVMGIDQNFPLAFAKSQIAAGTLLPTSGMVFISVRDADKEAVVPVARMLADIGFAIVATTGTARVLQRSGVDCKWISKLGEGRPNIKDFIKNGEVQLIVNTPTRKGPQTDEGKIRAMAVLNKVPIVTTLTGANAVAKAIAALQRQDWGVRPLQEYFLRKPE